MNRSIVNKIEQLLAEMTGNESPLQSQRLKEINAKIERRLSAENINKFCRMLPLSLFNLVRSAKPSI